MRNALQASRIGGKRNFVCKNGYNFGWEYIKEQLTRDKNQSTPLTKLSEDGVNGLDGWAKMNVKLAKVPFTTKTIAEGLARVCLCMNIQQLPQEEIYYEKNENCFCPSLAFEESKRSHLLGVFMAKYNIIMEKLKKKEKELENMFQLIMSQMSTIAYQIVIHDIFIEVLMNRELHFCTSNITGLEKHLTNRMSYFAKWKQSVKKKTPSHGYIGYAKQALNKIGISYVPMLHSNTLALNRILFLYWIRYNT